jgi:RimJ/RimL family protein N-acetyltransferase
VRGQGLSTHTVAAVVELARAAGVVILRAEAEVPNLPARRALEGAGFAQSSRTKEAIVYDLHL